MELQKFIKLYEEKGYTLEDITANLGVLLADDNAFSSNAEMKIARLDAWDYLNQVYKIACKCL